MFELRFTSDARETAVEEAQSQSIMQLAIDFEKSKSCWNRFDRENARVGENLIEEEHKHAYVCADVDNTVAVL